MKKKTVITTEKREVWVIRHGPDSSNGIEIQSEAEPDHKLLPTLSTEHTVETDEESDASKDQDSKEA